MPEYSPRSSDRSDLEQQRLFALDALDEDARREYWAALALRCTPGLGRIGACTLLKHFGSAWEAVRNPGLWHVADIMQSVAEACSSGAWRNEARPEWEAARHFKGHILLWTDPRYPRALRELEDAPALLYAVGDLALLEAPCIGIVGSRKCSSAALDFVAGIAEELSTAGITVVSGMAFGIDARAHFSALNGPGRTIAVLAGGADVPYPAAHTDLYRKIARQGLIVSEMPPGTSPGRGAFPVRNRIISGLSLGILMAEAEHEKSGSLITARLAAEQGRNVYVPSPDALQGPYSEGTKLLLRSGAFPVWQAGDIIADLFPLLKHAAEQKPASIKEKSPRLHKMEAQAPVIKEKQKPEQKPPVPSSVRPSLSPDENALLQLLSPAPLSPDDLLLVAQEKDTSWTAPRLLASLMMLEVKKQVRRLSDSRYEVRP